MEVEPVGQCGRVAIRSGQNVLEAEKLTSSISWKPSDRQP